MTPTPEDIELAERIEQEHKGGSAPAVRRAILAAIMEVRENVATFLDATPHTYSDPISGVNIRTPQVLATAIRNGEHLR